MGEDTIERVLKKRTRARVVCEGTLHLAPVCRSCHSYWSHDRNDSSRSDRSDRLAPNAKYPHRRLSRESSSLGPALLYPRPYIPSYEETIMRSRSRENLV